MRTGKKLLALGLAASLMMGMGMTAFAAETQQTTEATKISTSGQITLTNTLTCAEGVVAPAVTYTYDFDLTGHPATVTDQDELDDLAIADQRITVSNSSKTGSAVVDLHDYDFPVAGKYTYTITQSTTYVAGTDESLTDTDATFYTVYVYVKNGTNGTEVSAVTAEVEEEDGKKVKVESLSFAETFNKLVSLDITKTVEGEYGDKSLGFHFYVGLTFPDTYDAPEDAYTMYTFTLADGETKTIENVPAGTTYTVVETQENGYTGSAVVTSNGVKGEVQTAAANVAVRVEGLVGATAGSAATNSADFTNTHEGIIITGVTTNNLPFVAMIVVALAALAGFAVISKRRVR